MNRLLLCILLFTINSLFSYDLPNLVLTAKAYCIQDFSSKKIIIEKNRNEAFPMASLTKLGTAVLSTEIIEEQEYIKVPPLAIVKNNYESKADLKVNEYYLYHDLLYGLLLPSGNDVARSISFQLESKGLKFSDLSKEWIKKNNLSTFYFEESVGLSSKSKTNINDLLIILDLVEKNKNIFNVLQKKEYSFSSKNGNEISVKSRTPISKNKDIIIFGKTGRTKSAGQCFGGFFQKKSKYYKIAILGSENLESDLLVSSEFISSFID